MKTKDMPSVRKRKAVFDSAARLGDSKLAPFTGGRGVLIDAVLVRKELERMRDSGYRFGRKMSAEHSGETR